MTERAGRRPRRGRHGRSPRAAAGRFPGGTTPSQRLRSEVDAAIEALRDAGLPAYRVEVRELPAPDLLARAQPSDLAAGSLLGAHGVDPDGELVVLLYERPLLTWADDPRALRGLVRHTLVTQLATATGRDPGDIDRQGS